MNTILIIREYLRWLSDEMFFSYIVLTLMKKSLIDGSCDFSDDREEEKEEENTEIFLQEGSLRKKQITFQRDHSSRMNNVFEKNENERVANYHLSMDSFFYR